MRIKILIYVVINRVQLIVILLSIVFVDKKCLYCPHLRSSAILCNKFCFFDSIFWQHEVDSQNA